MEVKIIRAPLEVRDRASPLLETISLIDVALQPDFKPMRTQNEERRTTLMSDPSCSTLLRVSSKGVEMERLPLNRRTNLSRLRGHLWSKEGVYLLSLASHLLYLRDLLSNIMTNLNPKSTGLTILLG
jgi:hypothetical protein